MNKPLGNLLFPNIKKDIKFYEELYPERNLEKGAIVTRFAPSPTGFVHMGSLRTALIAKKLAHDTKGVFFLRIEDTDLKRSVENGIEGIINDLNNFGITIDEGRVSQSEDKGKYGPYKQTERTEIYHTYAKHLIDNDLAYPCFCKEAELDEIRRNQEQKQTRIGYYGSYARCRYLSNEDIEEKLKNNEEFTIRLKSPGDFNNKIIVNDLAKGKVEFPENDLDVILLKSDGIPTYHFAHAIDDHLMRTTHVLRGDEWLSSYPVHEQLFKLFNFKLPYFCHLAPINKKENDSIRKLSKRKDPEAALSYYHEKGIPEEAVKLYLMTTANSNFEEWLLHNPDKTIDDYTFDFKKMSASGSLFDLDKLINISKNYISKQSKDEVYENTCLWAKVYDKEFYNILKKYPDYTKSILNIERETKKPRKDYGGYSDVFENIFYMYDEYFDNLDIVIETENYKEIINLYIDKYFDINDDKQTWFEKVKQLSNELGYASNMKDYKENPDNYKGSVADVSNIIRLALTSKTMTPDLYTLINILGKERTIQRLKRVI
ncbi:MAG TPA: glutamate--tRNA ligase [Mollicutes bacterium]|nr:glutamate--tRNA ligase [Mollicutes bacterium]